MNTGTNGSGLVIDGAVPPPKKTSSGGPQRRDAATQPRRRRLSTALAALAAGFAAACSSGEQPVSYELLEMTQAQTTIADCENELTSCIQTAGSSSDARGRCAVALSGCLTDVAAERVGQADLLVDCRASAERCLSGAVGLNDVSACTDVYSECSQDAIDEARVLVDDAQGTIQSTFDAALASVAGSSGVTSRAAGALRGCRASANTCLDGALSSVDVGACTDIFDVCVDGVIDVVDPILDPLPLPGPRQIFDATADCRSSARDCLRGAVDALDIRACRDLVGSCVDDARGLVDVVVDETNGVIDAILPGALGIPNPSEVLDCSGQLLSCLGSQTGPFACAADARDCLLQ